MKVYFIILLSVFLIACNEYTITNKTDSDIQLEKSGGDTLVIPAQSCMKLTEFLIGMGGDFPFSFKNCNSCKEEYTSGHYEIKNSDAARITVTESNKNTDCDETDDENSEKEQKNGDTDDEETQAEDKIQAEPVCESEDFNLVCQDDQGQTISTRAIQCRKSSSSDSFKVTCIGSKGLSISGLKPVCIKGEEDSQEPVCQESESTDDGS